MTFDQIHVPEGADAALEWAATREYELRLSRMERQRLGMTGGIRKAVESLEKLNAVLAGDPSAPPPPPLPEVNKPPAMEVRGG